MMRDATANVEAAHQGAIETTRADAEAWTTLHPVIVRTWQTSWLLLGVGLSLPLLAIGLFLMLDPPRWWYPVASAPAVLGAIAAATLARRRFGAWRFRREDALLAVRHGVMIRKETVMPYSRIQHVDVTQGPVARRFGLATLVVHTASADGHAVRIPGLRVLDAQALRDDLATRAGLFDPL
jgi:membrane protein YdbS with pleckstrin-like domain